MNILFLNNLIVIFKKRIALLCVFIALCFFLYVPCKAQDHSQWTVELKKYVSEEGRVKYAEWKKNTKGIDEYLLDLSNHPVQSYWTRSEKLAYWINAYNAFTIKLILDHHPIQSIQDIEDGRIWDKIWITLGDKTYSLNQIENDIIRPQFTDPRIHFALNCAAVACPPLYNEAFEEAKLQEQLETRTKLFVNNPSFNQFSEKVIRISQLFNWYNEDFKPGLILFFNHYLPYKISSDVKIVYLPYDWNLNE